MVGRETPAGTRSTYTYDLAGQRTALTTSGRTLTHELDPAGRETTRTWNGVLSLTQGWDPTGRVTTQSYATTAPLLQHNHAWRPDGHLAATDDARYTLDATGRVTHVNAATWQESYAYDQAGNQTEAAWSDTFPYSSEATGPRTYTGTRIRTAGSIRYEYDAAGRTTLRQKARLSRKPDTWRYTWDPEDRLTSVVIPDGTTWRYTYDALGRRTTKERLASDATVAEETVFTWLGSTLIEQTTTSADWPGRETLTWEHDASGLTPLTQTTRYASAADAPQSEIDARFHAIVTDLIGTPTHLVDESGHIAWHARATLWGTTTWNHDATAYIPLRFPGQYHDLETGHHYNLHRHYDPESARCLTPDPLGLGPAPNPVAYVHNPHTWIDPLGLAPCPRGRWERRADFTSQKVMNKKYDAHASDFNLTANRNKQSLIQFERAMRDHMVSPGAKIYRYNYRGQGNAVGFIDPGTRRMVMLRGDGTFWSAWKLSERQFMSIIDKGFLG